MHHDGTGFIAISIIVFVPAVKTEVDHENRKLQAEVASLERERARVVSEVDRLKEDLERTRAKLVDKKSTAFVHTLLFFSSRSSSKLLSCCFFFFLLPPPPPLIIVVILIIAVVVFLVLLLGF